MKLKQAYKKHKNVCLRISFTFWKITNIFAGHTKLKNFHSAKKTKKMSCKFEKVNFRSEPCIPHPPYERNFSLLWTGSYPYRQSAPNLTSILYRTTLSSKNDPPLPYNTPPPSPQYNPFLRNCTGQQSGDYRVIARISFRVLFLLFRAVIWTWQVRLVSPNCIL